MGPRPLVVFDMDGVLVDVSRSYRDAVRRSARLFFSGASGFELLPDPLFSLVDLAAVKQSGGLNNDWDLTFVVLNLLLSQVRCPGISRASDPWDRYRDTLNRCHVADLAARLSAGPDPLARLMAEENGTRSPFLAGLYTGDVGSGNLIKQIFQEIYLGAELFTATYGLAPRVHTRAGLIEKEALLVDPSDLRDLARGRTLAIATGRPGAEAAHPLRRFGIAGLFSRVMSLDDCVAEERKRLALGEPVSLSKPDPFMLDVLARDLAVPGAPCWYIGDMPDDMKAARCSAYGFTAVGLLVSAADRDGLRKNLAAAGAHVIVDDFPALAELLAAGPESAPIGRRG